ncbi:50S ribosomal protein L19 [bacterium]|nr:50S ribosomal protein L19 [bacterium]
MKDMDANITKKLEEDYCNVKRPEIMVGDNVKLHMKIKDGDKYRIQIFEGVVISIKGSGINKNIVVRKISNGVGVEKIVPLYAPVLDKVEVVKRGSVRRSKLYYLRGRVGKKALKINNIQDIYLTDEKEEVKEEVAEDSGDAKIEEEQQG